MSMKKTPWEGSVGGLLVVVFLTATLLFVLLLLVGVAEVGKGVFL